MIFLHKNELPLCINIDDSYSCTCVRKGLTVYTDQSDANSVLR